MPGNVDLPRPNGITRVRLRSNYLVVRADTGLGWLPFRDVFEVNGRAVSDRQNRLVTLLADATPADLARARALMDEGTRHDLGNLARTVNIPVLGLLFLHPDRASRTAFARVKTERVDGHPTVVYAFSESGTPTLVRGIDDRDVASDGRVWVDETTGAVRRTEHRVASGDVVATITVTFRDEARLAMLVPDRMDEVYRWADEERVLKVNARYHDYRRLQVDATESEPAVPRKPPGR